MVDVIMLAKTLFEAWEDSPCLNEHSAVEAFQCLFGV